MLTVKLIVNRACSWKPPFIRGIWMGVKYRNDY